MSEGLGPVHSGADSHSRLGGWDQTSGCVRSDKWVGGIRQVGVSARGRGHAVGMGSGM